MNDPQVTKYFKYVLLFTSASLIFLIGFFVGRIDFTSEKTVQTESQYYLEGDFSGEKVGVSVDLLWEAWNLLENNYINQNLNKKELLYGTIKGLIESLNDPYTQFLTPDETEGYVDSSSGKFEGIGAYLRYNGEYTVVETPIDGMPAQKSGLMAEDVILEVDGKDVAGKDSYTVAEMIKGEKGTNVTLKIYRPKDKAEMTFTITRDTIDIKNITLDSIDNQIGVVKIYKFNESSETEFKNQWSNVVDELVSNNVKSVIIDLRNNPGGVVSYVQYITEEFLNKGDLIMSEEDKNGNKQSYYASRDGKLRDKKLIILVNEGSASASEIMTGALQDHDKATVIGMPTVGKGVEQTVKELSDGSTMHIVFKKWLLPSGRQVTSDDPITPDIQVDLTTEDFQSNKDPQMDKAKEEASK